jgi:putative tryptophan/tyrosine transport system substrate-binding protein
MRRREVICFLGTVGLWPFTVHAQQQPRMKRVAMVHPATNPDDMKIGRDPNYTILFEEMKRLGYVEGVNMIVDRYSAEGRIDRYRELARDIVTTRPDVIFPITTELTLATMSETRTIPIVAWTSDPITGGIVSNLARPGGNVTGLSAEATPELGAKSIQLLADAVGKLSNARVLAHPLSWQLPVYQTAREAAEKMNIPLNLQPLQNPIDEAEYRRAFEIMQREQVDGVMVSFGAESYTYRALLGRLSQQFRLPSICAFTDSADAGALMSYAFDLKAGDRRIAAQIVEILNGGNPAVMPFFQEVHWELVINLKAAKELGLELPAGLVAGADRLIE